PVKGRFLPLTMASGGCRIEHSAISSFVQWCWRNYHTEPFAAREVLRTSRSRRRHGSRIDPVAAAIGNTADVEGGRVRRCVPSSPSWPVEPPTPFLAPPISGSDRQNFPSRD